MVAPTPFQRMVDLARREWRLLALATVFLAMGSGINLFYPQGLRMVIDQALHRNETGWIAQNIVLVMAILFVSQGVAFGMRVALFSVAGERVVLRLREELYGNLLRQEMAFFDERKTGELTNRLNSDTTALQLAITANFSMLLRDLAAVIGGLVMLFIISPRLTLVMLAVAPPVALGAVIYGRRVGLLSRDVQDALAQSNVVAEETLSGMRTVRSFATEARERQRYSAAALKAYFVARKRAIVTGLYIGVAIPASYGAVAFVLWYGGGLVLKGVLSEGAIASFLIYTITVSLSLSGLSERMAEFMRASGAAQRVFELMSRVPIMPLEGGMKPAQVKGSVTFEAVHFAYPSRKEAPVLKGLSLSTGEGEVLALVGPSGAGKSTIAALLARIYDPDSGRILLDGRDLRELDPSWLRRQIGTVAQEPLLFSCSIADNIRYGRPEASDADVEAAARTANAHDFISRFPEAYRTLVGERGVQLSGGQKQRIAIARALLKDPRLLILDEATSALDAESEHLVKEALERLMKGRTTFMIAHRLSTVLSADRVVVLSDGYIVQSGSHSILMEQDGIYRRLVERQFIAA